MLNSTPTRRTHTQRSSILKLRAAEYASTAYGYMNGSKTEQEKKAAKSSFLALCDRYSIDEKNALINAWNAAWSELKETQCSIDTIIDAINRHIDPIFTSISSEEGRQQSVVVSALRAHSVHVLPPAPQNTNSFTQQELDEAGVHHDNPTGYQLTS